MKKGFILFLIITLMFSVCACNSEKANSESQVSEIFTVEENNDTVSKDELICDSVDAFRFSDVDDGVIITQFINYDYVEYDKIIIPESIEGKSVVGIGVLEKTETYYGMVFDAVFGDCEVIIPDTVRYIGGEAFEGADGLVKLSGGKNCTTIGEHAFMNCVNLSEITFIDNVTDLADNAFTGCTKWEENH